MDAITYIQFQFMGLRERQSAVTLAGITTDELNRLPPAGGPQAGGPPAGANTIGAILLHAIQGEDLFVQKFFRQVPMVWYSQGWGERFGIPDPPAGDVGWPEANRAVLCLEPLLAYHQSVCAETDAFLAGLTPADLDREVAFFGYQVPIAHLCIIITAHTAQHQGEIELLRGMYKNT